jgi:DNA-binding response OmpR family regulator
VKILVVDHEKKVADAIKSEMEDVLVRHALDGETGLKLATEKQFDLVVINWELPKKDGLSVMKELRDRKIPIPVLMLTAEDSVKDIIRSLDAGANDCLMKPFENYVLRARMKALIRRHRWDLCQEVPYPHFQPDLNISILIVDGYESSRDAMARLIAFKLPEIVVHVAENIRDGLEICTRFKINIVITDIHNCISLYSMVNNINAINENIKLVITTGLSEKDELNNIAKLQNANLLRKPIDLSELLIVIQKHVEEIDKYHFNKA